MVMSGCLGLKRSRKFLHSGVHVAVFLWVRLRLRLYLCYEYSRTSLCLTAGTLGFSPEEKEKEGVIGLLILSVLSTRTPPPGSTKLKNGTIMGGGYSL